VSDPNMAETRAFHVSARACAVAAYAVLLAAVFWTSPVRCGKLLCSTSVYAWEFALTLVSACALCVEADVLSVGAVWLLSFVWRAQGAVLWATQPELSLAGLALWTWALCDSVCRQLL